MSRINLISNPSFKTNVSGWSAAQDITKRIVNSQRSSVITHTITNSYRTGTTVTITTSAAHNLAVGNSVSISGTNGNPSIEGTYTITEVPTTTTFKYTTSTSGTITSAPDTGTVDLLSSGKTATITTADAHGFLVGDTVTISGTNGNSDLHGTWTIVSVPTTTTFTYTTTTRGTITSAADTGTAKVFGVSPGTVTRTIVNSERSSTTAKITTSTDHGFCAGQVVTIAGTNGNPSLEGTYTITGVPSSTTFTYTTSTSGTITSAADTGTAVVVGTFIARTTNNYFVGSSSLEVTKANITNSGVVTSSRIQVSPSTSYAFSAYVKIPVGETSSSLQMRVSWYNSSTGGLILSTSTSTSTTIDVATTSDADSHWVQLGDVVTSPSSASYVTIAIVQPSAGTASKKFLVDAVLLEASSVIGSYLEATTQAQEFQKTNLSLTPLPQPHLTGMKLQSDVRINGLTLNTIDENGVTWVATEIKGWWNHPEPDMQDMRRGWGDGSYDVKGRYSPRLIELTGSFLTTDPSQVPAARNKLVEATNLVYRSGILETDENPTKFSYVRLNGGPSIETVSARGRTDFTIPLKAADPIKYEWYIDPDNPDPEGYRKTTLLARNDSLSRTGITTVTNTGNYPVPVYFELNGPGLGNLQIFNRTTDELIIVVGQLRGAQTLTVTNKSLTNEVATLTLSAQHNLVEDDEVVISGVGSPFDGTYTVTAVSTTTFSYSVLGASNVSSAVSSGSVVSDPDLLEIDTYNRQVFYNGLYPGAREKLEIALDWIVLNPGENQIELSEKLTATTYANSTATLDILYRSGWLA
jgi:hypothetical protein